MNKTELAAALAAKTGSSKSDAAKAIDALFNTDSGIIATTCRGGEKVVLTGFGTFEQRTQAARTGVNPATGAKIAIAEKQVIKFKPGKGLKG